MTEDTPAVERRPAPGRMMTALVLAAVLTLGCESASPRAPQLSAQQALSLADFAALVDRISEPGGYFDTDNLISNESGYLKVVEGLAARVLEGGGYVGVGPDQNFSYIAELRPAVAFIVDVRRDNMLHHLLLKALVERSATRIELLSGLHGVEPPPAPEQWTQAGAETVVAWVDSVRSVTAGSDSDTDARSARAAFVAALQDSLMERVSSYGIPLSDADLATIRRFHTTFVEAGPSLRFTTFGRAPRPYYPSYRQLVLETDAAGRRVSYLASAERYGVVRALQLDNRIVPVVGDLAGDHAVSEIGAVLREMRVDLDAFYVSNVEFYLWRARTFDGWVANARTLPASDEAVVIRSYFPSFGRPHPSAVPGYHATQALQPLASLTAGGFASYWEVVTRDVLPLR